MPVSRLRFKDVMDSRLPADLGICQSDWVSLARLVNAAQERLITCPESGDTGWWGSYAEIVFNVSRNNPCVTLPRGAARLIAVDACDMPVPIRNQFYEYLQFGSGRWPKSSCSVTTCLDADLLQTYRRSVACTFSDLQSPGKTLRFYPTDPADVNKTVLVGCLDANGSIVTTLSNGLRVNGVATLLATPFVDLKLPGTTAQLEISSITGIQKDITLGQVMVYEVDIATGAQRLILTMEPGEKVAAYQVYYLKNLPQGCCNAAGASDDSLVQVTAMVKLDLIPVVVDSDYLLIQSTEAIIAECQSIRYSEMDSAEAVNKSLERHRAAVRYLNGQLRHYEGQDTVAVSFKPFGSASLANQRIGRLM